MESNSTRRFVRRAPCKSNPARRVDIRITDMRAADAAWWDRKLGPYHRLDRTRADRRWVWSALLPFCCVIQQRKQRTCRALVIWARDGGRFIRVGMAIVIEGYPHVDVTDRSHSNFVWFISAADSDVLKYRHGVSDPPSLGRVLIDCALVSSEGAGFEGRISLHASREGGQRLLDFYLKRGLIRLTETAQLPVSVRRRNDGRFFYANASVANSLARALDPDR
jgi:hypothetical protein